MANNIDWKEVEELAAKFGAIAKTPALTASPYTGAKLPLNPSPKGPGRPVGSKTKDKEVIIQETVDRLIEHVVRLLTKYNYGEEHLSDAEIVVDEKANYAFVTVSVCTPDGSVVAVSERVKVANKTDPSKNWQALNKAFNKKAANASLSSGKITLQQLQEEALNPVVVNYPITSVFPNDDK